MSADGFRAVVRLPSSGSIRPQAEACTAPMAFMINDTSDRGTLATVGQEHNARYVANQPWPHLVIDDFVDPEWLERVRLEASAIDRSKRYAKFLDRKTDHNKFAFLPDVVGPETARLVNCLNSGHFLTYLEKLTGVPGLLADPSYFGGGLHKILPGGFLEIHADFNHLKRYDLERRLNLLLYLNKDWQPSYQGELELWDRPTMKRVAAIAPIFNRCVIFSTTAESLHGHPAPVAAPPGMERMSIALYYYTNTWKPVAGEHSTLYYISRNNKVRVRVDRIIKTLIQDLTPPIVRKSIRALKRRSRGEKTIEV
jgi:Rps23 Pro-64 3,4-dihydroxylase Tpa1-like proline 4-hydroxylase